LELSFFDSISRVERIHRTHIACVKRGNEMELFVNGKKESSCLLSHAVVFCSLPFYIAYKDKAHWFSFKEKLQNHPTFF
jgi:hypothetical protein